jgi:mRNA interferase MazF
MSNNPNRGEVCLVDLGYVAKVIPCLVISIPVLDEDRALVTLVPHTTRKRGTRFEVEAEVKLLRSGIFNAQNLVTIPSVKLIKKLGILSSEQLAQVEDSMRL